MNNPITVETVVNASLEKVWEAWTAPEHITKWAFADESWEAPHAENDVRTGGKFLTRMQSRDGKEGFDFGGVYAAVKQNELIEYDMGDPSTGSGQATRHVKITFEETPDGVKVTQTFDPENENTREMQRNGWQAILDNFKKYVEERRENK